MGSKAKQLIGKNVSWPGNKAKSMGFFGSRISDIASLMRIVQRLDDILSKAGEQIKTFQLMIHLYCSNERIVLGSQTVRV